MQAPPKVAPKKGVRVERLKTSEPRQNGFLGKFYQQKLPSWRLESKSPLFAGILLFVCGAVLAILGTLMCIGLQGKVEYLIQYDGAPVNPMDESATPVRTNWTVGDDVDGLQKGFTRHRNVRVRLLAGVCKCGFCGCRFASSYVHICVFSLHVHLADTNDVPKRPTHSLTHSPTHHQTFTDVLFVSTMHRTPVQTLRPPQDHRFPLSHRLLYRPPRPQRRAALPVGRNVLRGCEILSQLLSIAGSGHTTQTYPLTPPTHLHTYSNAY